MRKTLTFCFVLILLSGCEVNKDFLYTSEEELITLNGLWCPDSIMAIKLSKTLPFPSKETSFPPVTDASIALYENGLYAGDFSYNTEARRYEFNRFPEAGKYYAVEVEVPGYPLLKAATKIPEITEVTACYKQLKGLGGGRGRPYRRFH